nr:MAG: hypothetical protein [Bacteriophage sp.]
MIQLIIGAGLGLGGVAAAVAIDPGIQPVEVGLAAGEWVMYQLQKGRE